MFLSIVSSVRLSSVIMSSTPFGPKARSSLEGGGFAMAHHLQQSSEKALAEREQGVCQRLRLERAISARPSH